MKKKLNILLIEDDKIEIMKFNRTLSSLNLDHDIIEAKNGEEALQILEDKQNSLPDIILLDLNMPKISGIEFLSILKKDTQPTSNNEKDLVECYKIGIAGYVLKPLKYDDYVSKIERLLNYWSINELKK